MWRQLIFLLYRRFVGKIILIIQVSGSGHIDSWVKNIDSWVKEIVLLCQQKVHMKPIKSFYFVIQQCQVQEIFVFYIFYCKLKEKYHIRRNKNNKKRNVYMWNQYHYFYLIKLQFFYNNKLSSLCLTPTSRH